LRARGAGTLPLTFATFIASGEHIQADPRAEISSVEVSVPPPRGWHAAAFKVTLARSEVLLLAAVERQPQATAGRPGALWGTHTVQTDGRIALTRLSGDPNPTVLIHGVRLENPAGLVRA
jgi:hypothetical protein